jgi:NTE family protein
MGDPLDAGLALSGGGYRAMLFNLGSIWRLNELGFSTRKTRRLPPGWSPVSR